MRAIITALLFVSNIFMPFGISASLPDFERAAELINQSFVTIKAKSHPVSRSSEQKKLESDPIFKQYFGEGSTSRKPSEVLASGFFVSANGYILTESSLAGNVTDIKVTTHDERVLPARVVGQLEFADVVFLKVQGSGFRPVKLGDSDKLKQGRWLMAMGSPSKMVRSVTAGVVSALGRSIDSKYAVPFLQTDIKTSFGSAGGPVFNSQAEVVGISMYVYARGNRFSGASFAVPINLVRKHINRLIRKGSIEQAWLGINVQDWSDRQNRQNKGAIVAKVEAGSSADRAGLQAGDIIQKFDSKPIRGANDVVKLVRQTEPGKKITMLLIREGERIRLTVKLLSRSHHATELEPPDEE